MRSFIFFKVGLFFKVGRGRRIVSIYFEFYVVFSVELFFKVKCLLYRGIRKELSIFISVKRRCGLGG